MTIYVNWMQYSQNIKGDLVPTEGNPVADHETPSSGVATNTAPKAAQYASVWSTAAITIEATNLSTNLGSDVTMVYPANTVVQIPNITSATTLTITEL